MQTKTTQLNRKAVLTASLITSLLIGLGGCVTTEQGPTGVEQEATSQQHTITANVYYLQRIALPPGAQVSLILEETVKVTAAVATDSVTDVAIATGVDAEVVDATIDTVGATTVDTEVAVAKVIAEQTITAATAPPYKIDLNYSATQINPEHSYVLRAKIEHEGKLLFTNAQPIAAFANQTDKPIEILVSQPSVDPKVALVTKQWQLSMLGEQAITAEVTKQIPYLTFNKDDNSLFGFAGCNRFRGSYEAMGNTVSLTQLSTTKKMCFQQMNLETQFLTVLSEADNFKVSDKVLTLYSISGIALGQFSAQ